MAIFSKSTEKRLAEATAARDKLAERLNTSEIAVTDNRKAAEGLALAAADDAKLDEAEARTRASVDRVATLKAALAQAEVVVANLEKERDEAAGRKQREATSAEIEGIARAIAADCSRLIAIAASLHGHTAQAAVVVPESGGVLNLCQIIAIQIPEASRLISKLLRVHSEAVLGGSTPATLPKREAIEQQIFQLDHPPPVVPPEPERLAPPIMHSAFEKPTIGPAVQLKIATRSEPPR